MEQRQQDLIYNGSMVALFYSQIATAFVWHWWLLQAARAQLDFRQQFYESYELPPGTPRFARAAERLVHSRQGSHELNRLGKPTGFRSQ